MSSATSVSLSWIMWIAGLFPVRHFANGMLAAIVGTPFHWSDVIVVAAWGLAGVVLAVRFFSWEPRTNWQPMSTSKRGVTFGPTQRRAIVIRIGVRR